MSEEITNEKLFEFMTNMYSDLGGKINGIENKIDKMEVKMDKMEKRMDSMESKMNVMENKINDIDSEVKKINAKIDHEIMPKLSALFDGYKQNSDKLERIEDEVSKQEEIILRKIK